MQGYCSFHLESNLVLYVADPWNLRFEAEDRKSSTSMSESPHGPWSDSKGKPSSLIISDAKNRVQSGSRANHQ